MNAIYGLDVEVFRAIHVGLHSSYLDPIFWCLTWLGDGGVQAVLIALALVTRPGRKWIIPLMAALLVGGIAGAQGLKHLLPRQRPSNLPWAHPEELIYSNSFPSGHTTSSFAIATTLFLLTRHTRQAWLGWACLGLSVFVGMSRVYRGVHWPTDVLGGMFTGIAFGCLTYLVWQRVQPAGESGQQP